MRMSRPTRYLKNMVSYLVQEKVKTLTMKRVNSYNAHDEYLLTSVPDTTRKQPCLQGASLNLV